MIQSSDPAGSDLYTTCKEDTFFGKFQPDSLKTERLVCVETDGQTDLVCVETDGQTDMLLGRKRLLHCVANGRKCLDRLV